MNHVLEHVKEEGKVFSEIKRCLKDNGVLIMSFPISLIQNTFEDKNISSEKDRLKIYGQKDHCRLYGKDVVEYFSQYGIEVQENNVSSMLSKEDIKRKVLIENDRVYMGRFKDIDKEREYKFK